MINAVSQFLQMCRNIRITFLSCAYMYITLKFFFWQTCNSNKSVQIWWKVILTLRHICANYVLNKKEKYIYWLSAAKRWANGRSNFWLSIKSISNTLSCCFVCAFIIGQYHSGNNMSSRSGAAGEILFFESEKRHKIRPLKTDTLTVSAFDAFIHVHDESKHHLSHRFAQRRCRFTQCI